MQAASQAMAHPANAIAKACLWYEGEPVSPSMHQRNLPADCTWQCQHSASGSESLSACASWVEIASLLWCGNAGSVVVWLVALW